MQRRKWVILCLIAFWGMLAIGGALALEYYAAAPGDPGTPVERWPSASNLPRSADRFTLVMFLHPRCPCSQASLTELSRLLTRAGTRHETLIVFTRPPGLDFAHDGALWERAVAMEGVTVVEDKAGEEALRFGAMTSGHTLLFDTSGRRVFTGGITPARGHEGDNAGAHAITEILRQAQTTAGFDTPVYGCSLLGKALAGVISSWTQH